MRKNLRGLPQHLQAMVDRIAKTEFRALHDELESIPILTGCPSDLPPSFLATWHGDYVEFHTLGAREWYLRASDEKLAQIIRHELLHGELALRGEPSGDDDLPFIMECLRRKLPLNDSSTQAFETQYGKGSFNLFRLTLPPPEYEEVVLAGAFGCWLKEKPRRWQEGDAGNT